VWEWWKHRKAAKELREDIVDVVKDELTDDDSAAPSRAVETETRASRRAAQSAPRRDRAPFDQTRD